MLSKEFDYGLYYILLHVEFIMSHRWREIFDCCISVRISSFIDFTEVFTMWNPNNFVWLSMNK